MFHDAPVSGFTLKGDELHIETEEFSFGPGEILPAARIVIGRVREVFRNDAMVATFTVESDDAEIHHLENSPDGVRIDLIWQFWTPRKPYVFTAYRFPGATLHIEALSGAPLRPLPI